MTTEQRKVSRRVPISRRIILQGITTFILSFLMSRVSIAREMHPFGGALLICCFFFGNSLNPFCVIIGIYAALCSAIPSLSLAQYNFCVVSILCVTLMIYKLLKLKKPTVISTIAAAAAYIASALIFKNSVLFFLWSIGELLISLIASRIFLIAVSIFSSHKRRLLDDSELMSLIFICVISLAGIGSITGAGVHIINIISALFCLIASYYGKSTIGTACASFLALAFLISGIAIKFSITLVVSSAIAGLLNKVSRPIFATLFLASGAIGCALCEFSLISLVQYAIACIIFCFIPSSASGFISTALCPQRFRKYNFELLQKRFKEATSGEIRQISKVLNRAARSLDYSAKLRNQTGIQYALANIPEQCCNKCENYEICWDKQFESSYIFLKNMYERYCLTGKISEKDININYKSQCINQKRLIYTLNFVFKEYTINSRLENKAIESRYVISEQLNGIAYALNALDKRILESMEISENLEEELAISLDKLGYPVCDVSIITKGNKPLVNIRLKNISNPEAYQEDICRAVCAICKRKMCLSSPPMLNKHHCSLSYSCANKIALKTAVSRATKNGSPISGDTYTLKPLPNGQFMMLICDGMGSGKRAQQESFAVADLIEDYYTAGFDSKRILRMINKLMLLSSSDEIFSALDLCIIDLNSAQAHFTKIGAPHSYIISNNKIRRLSASALPLGILEDFDSQEYSCELNIGDLIILFSDGIAETELNDNNLYYKITSTSPSDNVKCISDRILSSTISACGGRATDDMTVLVARVIAA